MGNLLISIGGGGGADLDVITATSSDVLEGKVIVDKEGEPIVGTVTNQGAITANLNAGGSYTVPAGYHNGQGKVTANSLASQTGVQSGKSAAGAGQVLTGYEAWVNGGRVTGTMANQGAKTAALNCGGSYTIPAGYHNGQGKVTANSLASQTDSNAAAGDILSGKTAWVKGSKITGNIASQGPLTYTPSTSTQTANISGKYMTGNITFNAIPSKYKDCSGATISNNNQMLSGIKAVGANGTLYTGSITSMNGGTYAPSGSQQTISCSGKKMNSNIVISAIPSKYVDVTKEQAFFENGSYGPLADLGAYKYVSRDSVSEGNGFGNIVSIGEQGAPVPITNKELTSSLVNVENAKFAFVFRRAFPGNKYKRIEITLTARRNSVGTSYHTTVCLGLVNKNKTPPPGSSVLVYNGYKQYILDMSGADEVWAGTISVDLSDFGPPDNLSAYQWELSDEAWLQIAYTGVSNKCLGSLSISKIVAKA